MLIFTVGSLVNVGASSIFGSTVTTVLFLIPLDAVAVTIAVVGLRVWLLAVTVHLFPFCSIVTSPSAVNVTFWFALAG